MSSSEHQDGSMSTAAGLARMWGAVSRAHDVLDQRRTYFLTSEADVRMGEQLTLIAMLADWVPPTAYEVDELTFLLEKFVRAGAERRDDRVAVRVVDHVRTMARNRARSSAAC